MADTQHERSRDLFAEIASQRSAGDAGRGLIEPGPPRLPRRCLSMGKDLSAAFRPARKIDSEAKLRRELERMRRVYAKYLGDRAPVMGTTRSRIPLDRFDWRIETDADRRDFVGVCAGMGMWESVKIPHYGGPLGRATAYYRTTFEVTPAMLERGALFVAFKGVDYKAHVFVNRYYLGSHEGFFAPFEFAFAPVARVGENVLVVKVENDAICLGNESWDDDHDGDKLYAATGPGYDDPVMGWHHCPPGMGIYQKVCVESRAPIHIHDVFVRSVLSEERAEAWVEIYNCGIEREPVSVELSVFGQNFRATVFRNRVYDAPGPMGPTLNYVRLPFALPKARVWDLETPWLYQAQVRLRDKHGTTLDAAARSFGMRSFTMDEGRSRSDSPKGRFRLNGREIRLRGANTMGHEQQCVIKEDWGQLRDDILLAKIGHMNFLRLTQRPVQDEVYDWCDQLGLMTQTDLPLFGCLRRNQFAEAVRQAEEMERLVRGHPCNIAVTYINEPAPTFGGGGYRQLTRRELEWFFTAADQAVRVANPDRVIKPVDGDYDPPAQGLPDNHCYCGWYNGHGLDLGMLHKGYWQRVKPGWFYGCGEFGAEGLDPIEVMRRHYPESWLPQTPEEEAAWSPSRIVKAQTGRFHYMWFETQKTLAGWVEASLAHQAWVTQLLAEAFRRDGHMNSCAIHLFIDAFPSGWMKAIMDCERRPKPAYFAYREALTPLMANLRTDRYAFWSGEEVRVEAWVCNDRNDAPPAFLHYQAECNGAILVAGRSKAEVPVCGSAFQGFMRFRAPRVEGRTPIIVRLGLLDARGRVLHDTALELELFPPPGARRLDRVTVAGTRRGKAHRLASDLGLRSTSQTGDVIVIDDIEAFHGRRAGIERAISEGATAIFLELPPGQHTIGGDTITVVECGMGARHFVSRDTGHPMVRGFAPDDFKFWHDPEKDHVTPLLETTFTAPGWRPILLSGNGQWGEAEWEPALAAAERPFARGIIRICQVRLAGRTRTNPVAHLFARRLLSAE